MQIITNGKRNIKLPDTQERQRVILKDINGDIVSYIKTGKNGGRITGVVPEVVFAELEEVPLRPVNVGALNIAKTLDLTDEMNLVLEKQNAIRQAFSAVLDFKAEIEDKFIKNKEQTDIALSELAEVARNTGIINDERYEEIKAIDLAQSIDIEKIYSICRDLSGKAISIENDILNITNVLASHEHEKQTKESLGLGNVDNTSDIDKPVSKAVQDALDEKVSKEELTEFAEYIERLKKRQGEIEDGIQSLGGICANPIPIGGKVGDVLMKRSDLDGDFWWAKPASSENATEEKAGIAKIATQDEAKQGTDDTKIMTPLKVKTVLSDEVLKLNAEIDSNADAILKTRNDLQAEIDDNAGDIAGLQAETTTIRSDLDGLGDQVSGIEEKIPDTATSSNQLADKNFVNSSIATETATFKGTFNNLEELKAVSADNNDYGFVISKDTAGNTIYNRYKYNGSEWVFEYALNNSSFTASQWASINSGATQTNISQITTNKNDIDELGDQVSGIEEKIPSNASVSNQLATKSYVDGREQAIREDYMQADSELQTQINGQATAITEAQGDIVDLQNNKQDVISDLDTIRSGAVKGATAVQPNDLSTVATSGSYNDLTNKPTIPTVNNGTLTIQKNGVQVATFSANQSGNVTANIVADTQVNADWNATSGAAQILNKPTLSAVATSGSYNDLTNKPTIPSATSQLTNDSDYTTKNYVDTTEQEIIENYMQADTDLQTQITGLSTALTTAQGDITTINSKIPTSASSSNLLITNTELTNATQSVRSDFADADSELQTQITGLSGTVSTNQTDIVNLKAQKYGADLSYTDSQLQLLDQDGNALGSSVEITGGGSGGSSNDLFDHKWADHILNDIQWLRADTFSWQSGSVYEAAYQHLVDDFTGTTSATETIGSYTITYYLAEDGHKIVLPDMETTVQNIYNELGVAWYYILDTANQRFKLPRELPITDKSKGNGMTLGITNGVTNAGLASGSTNDIMPYNALYGKNTGTAPSGQFAFSNSSIGVTTDPTKSGIISHRENENGKQYLYFYVGNYTQSAVEQTAGLNAELFNGKADLDLSNTTVPHLVETYQNGTSWYRVWSDGWCEQGGVLSSSDRTQVITCLKNYLDTNYILEYQINAYSSNARQFVSFGYNKTVSGFTVDTASVSNTTWCTKGYIA